MNTPRSGNRNLQRILPLAGILALSFGLWLGLNHFQTRMQAPTDILSGTLLQRPRPLQPFALTDQDGGPFTLDELKQGWRFLAFGYTHCPDVCPTTLATFDAIDQRTRTLDPKPGFVFISVDPERDTPANLKQYVTYFNPEFRAATGPDPALKELTTQLGVLYARAKEQESAMGYLVDHSASILLIDPLGQLAALFSAPHDPAAIAGDFITITR